MVLLSRPWALDGQGVPRTGRTAICHEASISGMFEHRSTMKSTLWIAVLLAIYLFPTGIRAATPFDSTQLGVEAPSVLLVTFDTVRADRIGAYGHASAATPTLDGLAARGVLFESAVSPTPTTLPSHASILTGTYPSAHGVHDNGAFALERDARLISEVFRERGFRTAAFVGTYILDESFGLNQGFETYRGPILTLEYRMRESRRSANEVVDDAISWFEQLDPGERFFVWVHFYDPHRPLRANATRPVARSQTPTVLQSAPAIANSGDC
jgi:arylsulfatase A-like enzyme